MKSSSGVQARVLVVDDHPVVRLGLRAMLSADAALSVVAEADSAETALELAKGSEIDLALVELSLGHGKGLELVRTLHQCVPDLPILVFSARDEALFAERSLKAGARGYIMKREPIERLAGAIRRVLAGQIVVSDALAQDLLERAGTQVAGRGLAHLTNRELEVLQMIGGGLNTAAIAQRLRLSVKTIETYRSNIKTKLGLRDATDLIRYAAAWIQG
jgi:DNA-binding NarL/FixJ family response regulator